MPVMDNRKHISMVEVFKTDVKDAGQAHMLLDQIHAVYKNYKANFDLDDCDKILRVKCTTGEIHSAGLINLLSRFGFQVSILEDPVRIPHSTL